MTKVTGLVLFGALALTGCGEGRDVQYFLNYPSEKDAVVLGCIGNAIPSASAIVENMPGS